MENTNSLRIVKGSGRLKGFGNLFHAANSSWWHTKKWIIQAVLWLLVLNGLLMTIWSIPAEMLPEALAPLKTATSAEALSKNPIWNALITFFAIATMGLPIAAIIAGQDAIIGERQSGTAAWLLSKPVSRPAFILSKLAASSIGLFVTGVLIQGVVAYTMLSLRIGAPWSFEFLGAMGLVFLNLFFYLTMTYMLGSLCNNRGVVLGISLSMALMGPAGLRAVPILNSLTPWKIFIPIAEEVPVGLGLAMGQPLGTVIPIIGTAFMCLVFIAVTLLRFRREEF